MNPYQAPTTMIVAKRRFGSFGLAMGASLMGYLAPVACLALVSCLCYGWMAAVENLERIVKMHGKMDLNTLSAFTPNIVLALIALFATSKWCRSDDSHGQWWLIGGVTLVACVVVPFGIAQWNLISWKWSNEMANTVRSAIILLFPLTTYMIISTLRKY
ncbi:MAG: hypothetical protein JNL58_30345 [Planctomyces sp.]|nr:hypothetical protein [Planctomyces sp.]